MNVVFTRDLTYFRARKVRILNGAHSAMTAVGMLSGFRYVREFMASPRHTQLLEQVVFTEIVSSMDEKDRPDLVAFAREVMDRIRNHHLNHPFTAIALNYSAKIKVRLEPNLHAYYAKYGRPP